MDLRITDSRVGVRSLANAAGKDRPTPDLFQDTRKALGMPVTPASPPPLESNPACTSRCTDEVGDQKRTNLWTFRSVQPPFEPHFL